MKKKNDDILENLDFQKLMLFVAEADWNCDKVPEQIRAFFTTLCFKNNVLVDTIDCDKMLSLLYDSCIVDGSMSYEAFEDFMTYLIV